MNLQEIITIAWQINANASLIKLKKEATSINRLAKTNNSEIKIDDILKIVSDYNNITIEDLLHPTRKRERVQARQTAMYFSKQYIKMSLAAIGVQIGNKDHATVLHACKTINNLIDTDRSVKKQISEIERKIIEKFPRCEKV